MVQYINDALPRLCNGNSVGWSWDQLSFVQQTSYRGNKFYTNLNEWNLFGAAQLSVYNKMERDNIGKFAYFTGRT